METQDVAECPRCGHENEATAIICVNCWKLLSWSIENRELAEATVGNEPSPLRYDRPGCVTLYAILFIVLGGFAVLGFLLLLVVLPFTGQLGMLTFGDILALVANFAIAIAFGAGILAVGIGLWRLRNWARVVVIIIEALSILGSLSILCTDTVDPSGATICSEIVNLAINGYILYWFGKNGHYFSQEKDLAPG